MLDSGAQQSDSVIHFFDHCLQTSPFVLPPTNPLVLHCCTFLLSLGSCVPVCNHLHACLLCAQSYQVFSDPIDCSLPGSSVRGIFQAWIPVWVAICYSRGSSPPRDWTHISCIFSIGRRILYLRHLGSRIIIYIFIYLEVVCLSLLLRKTRAGHTQ